MSHRVIRRAWIVSGVECHYTSYLDMEMSTSTTPETAMPLISKMWLEN